MTELFAAGTALLALALAFVVLGLWRRPVTAGESAREAQTACYRQRLDELARDRQQGLIDDQQLRELEVELERQLLSETPAAAPTAVARALGRWPLWLLLAALPLASYSLYQHLGADDELALMQLQRQLWQQPSLSPQDIQGMIAAAERSLQKRPEKQELLWLQARLHMETGQFAAAAGYYQRLVELRPDDAGAVAQWAQAIYLGNERRLDARVNELLQRALTLDPQQTTALGLLGVDAFARADYLAAIDFWQRLLRAQPANSPQLPVIAGGIAQAKQRALDAGLLSGLAVEVDLTPALRAQADGMLYVFAKADDGSALPVAVVRQPAKGPWPRTVLLTDADAMSPARKLSQFQQVSLTARISRGGAVMAQRGDLQGQGGTLAVAEAGVAKLLIDAVVD